MDKVIRVLRFKYGISARELARGAGVSAQRIYQIETWELSPSPYLEALLSRALAAVIRQREEELSALKQDALQYDGKLLSEETIDHERRLSHGI